MTPTEPQKFTEIHISDIKLAKGFLQATVSVRVVNPELLDDDLVLEAVRLQANTRHEWEHQARLEGYTVLPDPETA